MKKIDLEQGSDAWLEARLKYFCASEAPVMMGESKFMSRNQLLMEKKGFAEKSDKNKNFIFASGHESEKKARELLEIELLESFAPCVCVESVNGIDLLASLDGLSDDGKTIFEHKLINKTLAQNTESGLIEPHYYWQLEHQLLVAGADFVLFVVSDGTSKNRVTLRYESIPERRERLVNGWKQFAIDLCSFVPEAATEAVEGQADILPSITYSVNGLAINSDISQVLAQVRILADAEMSRKLECDQDFADKDAMNKAVKKARDELRRAVADVKSKFDAQAKFEAVASDLDAVLQKMQAHGEKLVTQEKERKKLQIINEAKACLNDFIELQAGKFDLINLYGVIDVNPDFISAVKGKRTLDSIKNAVDAELASAKIEVMGVIDLCAKNCETFKREAKGYEFLFNDLNQIVCKDSFELIINARIGDHQRAEEKRIEAEREKIRAEERAKAKAEAEQSTLMIATKQQEQVNAVTAGVNEYLVRAEWFGYSRGYSVYKVTAENEDVALDNYKLGSIVESVTVKSDVEDNDVAILKGKNQ